MCVSAKCCPSHVSVFLSQPLHFFRSYFSTDGIELNFGRVPIAGCDFSTHTYTYDDVPGDTNLTHFNLTLEDFYYKVSNPSHALTCT
jgi:glucosylceramidase